MLIPVNSMKRISEWLFFFFVATIPISSLFSSKAMVICIILALVVNYKDFRFSQFISRSWDLIIYLGVMVIGLLQTSNLVQGVKNLETSTALIGVAILFNSFRKISKREITLAISSFTLGLIIALAIVLMNAFITFILIEDQKVFFSNRLTSILNSHPTYLAYYIIATFTFILYKFYYDAPDRSGFLFIILCLFLYLMLILVGGSTSYVSLLLIFSFFLLKYFLDPQPGAKLKVTIVIILLLVSLFVVHSLKVTYKDNYWERSVLWNSAIKANPNPLIGVGTGDYKTVLNDYYLSHNLEEFAKESYNSHNQFIQFYFSNGIIGLIILVIMIGRPLYLSVRSQNALGILLMFPFIIYGVTEVFLGRYQGVVFFALLHQIVIYQYYSLKSQFSLKAG